MFSWKSADQLEIVTKFEMELFGFRNGSIILPSTVYLVYIKKFAQGKTKRKNEYLFIYLFI